MFEFRRASRLLAVAAMVIPVTLAGQGIAAAEPNDTPEARAAALIKPAIVYIEIKVRAWVVDETGNALNNGDPIEMDGRCSGFAVKSDGYIGTAGHCVDPDFLRGEVIQSVAKSVAGQRRETVDSLIEFATGNWVVEGEAKGSHPDVQVSVLGAGQRDADLKPQPARVVDFRAPDEGDVALLKVELGDNIVPSAELSPDDAPQVGDPVLLVGYPASTDEVTDFSLEPAVKSGTVSAKQTSESMPVFQVSAPMTKGMSGGPATDLKGRVIGLNSFSPTDEQQAFNYLVPIQGLKELLARNGVQPGLSSADKAFRTGLNAFFEQRYSDAIPNFDKALELSPQYPGAFEYRTRAARMLAEQGEAQASPSGSKTWMFVAGGLAIAALAGGGVLVFALSRRDKEPVLAGAGGSSLPATGSRAEPGQQKVGPAPIGISGAAAHSGDPTAAPPPPAPSSGAEVNCRNCGFMLASGAQFCPRCGKPQS